MRKETQQGRSGRQHRSLKVEATGDFYRQKITPRIRLGGKWLERAGFKPGHRAEIYLPQPGTMIIRFAEQTKESTL